MDQLLLRIRFVNGKIRNVVYYWDLDEKMGEARSRRNYMFALSTLRRQLVELVEDLKNQPSKENWEKMILRFSNIISLIPADLKTDGCREVIHSLRKNEQESGT